MQRALRNEAQANHSQPQNKAIADRDKRMEIKPKHQGGEERRNPSLAPPPPKKKITYKNHQFPSFPSGHQKGQNPFLTRIFLHPNYSFLLAGGARVLDLFCTRL
jgi:hypothetical protein